MLCMPVTALLRAASIRLSASPHHDDADEGGLPTDPFGRQPPGYRPNPQPTYGGQRRVGISRARQQPRSRRGILAADYRVIVICPTEPSRLGGARRIRAEVIVGSLRRR